MESFAFEQQVLFRVDIFSVTSDCEVPRTLNLRDLTVFANSLNPNHVQQHSRAWFESKPFNTLVTFLKKGKLIK